jgi:hypothetical protein
MNPFTQEVNTSVAITLIALVGAGASYLIITTAQSPELLLPSAELVDIQEVHKLLLENN